MILSNNVNVPNSPKDLVKFFEKNVHEVFLILIFKSVLGIYGVPPIRPLETLHNALSLKQLDTFLEKMTVSHRDTNIERQLSICNDNFY